MYSLDGLRFVVVNTLRTSSAVVDDSWDSVGTGVPGAAEVKFSQLLQAGGDRLENAFQLVSEVLTEASC